MNLYVHPKLRRAILANAKGRTLAACCLLFVSQLYLRSMETDAADEFFPLLSRLSLQIYTTRFYGPMLRLLIRLSAIELYRGGSYSPGEVSKCYRLSRRFRKRVQSYPVDCPRLESRLNKALTKASYGAMSRPALRWIVESYKHAAFPPDVDEFLERYKFETEGAHRHTLYHVANIKAGRLRFTVSRKSGRVFYSVANLPKDFRAILLIDGDPVLEVDISASQPTLLATLYPRDCPEKDRYLKLIRERKFYESIAAWAKRGWDRGEAKIEFFHQIAYGTFNPKYELLRLFEERFPKLIGIMRKVKEQGKSALAIQMQELEASIAIYGACGECAERKIRVLPVHDALICRKADAKTVQEIFARHWKKKTGITATFKPLPE